MTFTPIPSTFPPLGPSGLTSVVPAYLYQEYNDDEDLQAFFDAENGQQQNYVDTFNGLNLPIYTKSPIAGALLDWVGNGLYGLPRPALSTGLLNGVGPFNTLQFNQKAPYNYFRRISLAPTFDATDDIYRRILTWHFFKGDGKYFNIRWLKRRVMRFCYGKNGIDPGINQTYQISVSFGTGGEVTIRFVLVDRTITGGAIFNAKNFKFNAQMFNGYQSSAVRFAGLPDMLQFQEAVDTGVLELPFQFQYVIVIG